MSEQCFLSYLTSLTVDEGNREESGENESNRELSQLRKLYRMHGREHALAYIRSIANELISEAEEEALIVQRQIERLEERLDLARRRLRGASCETATVVELPGVPPVKQWLGTGREVAIMRERMKRVTDDESKLMDLVFEVRRQRDENTNVALQLFASKTNQLLEEGYSSDKNR